MAATDSLSARVHGLGFLDEESTWRHPAFLIGANNGSTSHQIPGHKRFPKQLIETPLGSKRAGVVQLVVEKPPFSSIEIGWH